VRYHVADAQDHRRDHDAHREVVPLGELLQTFTQRVDL